MKLFTCVWILLTLLPAIALSDDFNGIIDENPQRNLEREAWLDEMNRTEPGVDWRILAEEARRSKQYLRQDKVKLLLQNKKSFEILGIEEEFADGLVRAVWQEKGSNNQAGRVMTADIDFETGTIYLVSDGGNIWSGPLEGNNWTVLNNSMKFSGSFIRLLKFDNTRRIFVVSNRTCYYSDNEGLTWEESEGFENQKKWGSIIKGQVLNNNNQTIFVLTNEFNYDDWKSEHCFYRSIDRGKTFQKLKAWQGSHAIHEFWAPRYDDSRAFMIHKDTLFTLTADATFKNYNIGSKDLSNEMGYIKNPSICGSIVNGKPIISLAVKLKDEPLTIIFNTDNFGQSWAESGYMEEHNLFNRRNSFKTGLSDPDFVIYGSVDCHKSTNGGSSFIKQNHWGHYYGDPENLLHADVPAIDMFRDPDGEEVILISTDGGLYISYNNMESVKNLSMKTLNNSQYYDCLTSSNDPKVIFAGAQDQGFQRCTDDKGGICDFEQTISGDYGQLTSSDGGKTLWCNYPGFAMLYLDAEDDMRRYDWNFRSHNNKNWIPQIIADPADPEGAYICAGNNGGSGSYLWYLKFLNGVINAEQYDFNFKQLGDNANLTAFGVSTINTNYQYALTNNGKFAFSDTKGQFWQLREDFEGLTGHYFYGQKILPSQRNLGEFFIGGSAQNSPGVYHSDDNGETFSPLEGLPNVMVYDLATDTEEKLIFAATSIGPYMYIRAKKTWYDLSGLAGPDQSYWGVEYLPENETVRFNTYGRGIWDFKITYISPEAFVPVSVEDEPQIIKQSIICSPNPVSSLAHIEINLNSDSYAEVRLYDMEGRMIDYVFQGDLQKGTNKIDWNPGKKNIPSGMYLMTLSGEGNSSYTKVMIEN